MPDAPQQTRCNLCGSERYSLLYQARKKSAPASAGLFPDKPERVVRCLSCGVAYAIPLTPSRRDSALYSDMLFAEDYLAEEPGLRERSKIILSQVGHFKKRGRLLEVGCGPGFFLDEARKLGFEVEGVDLSQLSREHCARKFGIEVKKGTLAEAAYPDRSFDVIVINDVLAQLHDPKSALQEARRVLKNDGVLYLSTPDIDGFWSRLFGSQWWGIHSRHRFYFSKKALGSFFKVVGLRPAKYFSYPRVFSAAYWTKRLSSYPFFIRAPFDLLLSAGVKNGRFKVMMKDQIGVVSRKVHRLDSVIADEPKRERAKKMRVVVVLPAYNAEKTLERTVADIPKTVDEIILVDDCSRDKTVEVAKRLGLTVFQHQKNRGYGGNQKTCYRQAILRGADVAVMCHPDYQYDPKIIPQLVDPILRGEADAVFGSRMMKGGALEGGMPLWKHNANILLTAFENVMLGTYLTEYHSGFRAYSTGLLNAIDFEANSDNFIFDTEIIAQIVANHFKIEEVPIRTRYFEEASSIRLWPSVVYGLGIVRVMGEYALYKRGLRIKRFLPKESSASAE